MGGIFRNDRKMEDLNLAIWIIKYNCLNTVIKRQRLLHWINKKSGPNNILPTRNWH